MSITINLPPDLERELIGEARRDGIAPAERAELLLRLALALRVEGPETPFGSAVGAFFRRHQIDPDRLASALDQLNGACIPVTLHSTPPALFGGDPGGPSERIRLESLLRRWRDDAVHRPVDEAATRQPEVTSPRPSILGKYAYLGLSSEDFMREKQEEIDREDRRSWE
jgi:hypothetical protein